MENVYQMFNCLVNIFNHFLPYTSEVTVSVASNTLNPQEPTIMQGQYIVYY